MSDVCTGYRDEDVVFFFFCRPSFASQGNTFALRGSQMLQRRMTIPERPGFWSTLLRRVRQPLSWQIMLSWRADELRYCEIAAHFCSGVSPFLDLAIFFKNTPKLKRWEKIFALSLFSFRSFFCHIFSFFLSPGSACFKNVSSQKAVSF